METLYIRFINHKTSEVVLNCEPNDFKFLPREGDFIDLISKDYISNSCIKESKQYKVIKVFHSIQPEYDSVWINIYIEELPSHDSQ